MLVGDPDYYKQLGFRSLPDLVIDGVPQKNFLVLPFEESKARGVVIFHEGFTANGQSEE